MTAALALATTAVPAQAAPVRACAGQAGVFNACLTIEGTLTPNVWRVTAGLDRYMSQAACEAILPVGEFGGALYSNDDGFLDELTLAWVACGPAGLGVEFVEDEPYYVLDEDTDGKDELYAKINYFNPTTGRSEVYQTGLVQKEFRKGIPVD
nr:hypothetical protein Ade03nite_29450 [Actinoplanes derwentensis]